MDAVNGECCVSNTSLVVESGAFGPKRNDVPLDSRAHRLGSRRTDRVHHHVVALRATMSTLSGSAGFACAPIARRLLQASNAQASAAVSQVSPKPRQNRADSSGRQ